jgi:putative flavoprotein involved in K+ transport
MKTTNTVIIGGGQAGLAMSRSLTDRGFDHVVLECGRVAERWHSERWDSLRLLTPNWQSRLPGWRYDGDDPDGFMSMPEVIGYLERYARSFAAPVETGTTVLAVEAAGGRYRIATDNGTWTADNVVVATGYCGTPRVPGIANDLPGEIFQLTPTSYRNPDQLPAGGVLVVGASASGIQLTDEIHRSGRPVTLAVGRHLRLPRTYRGRDIMWWLDALGILNQTTDAVADIGASRSQPSLQLVGRADHRSLDLEVLREAGVRLTGRAIAADGGRVRFMDDLGALTAAADAKLQHLLERIDTYIAETWRATAAAPREPIAPIRIDGPPISLDLRTERIRTVIWATGFTRSYPWLRVPVLDQRGEIRHRGGVTGFPGLYVLGLNFMRRRNSTYLDGVGADACDLADHIVRRDSLRSDLAA